MVSEVFSSYLETEERSPVTEFNVPLVLSRMDFTFRMFYLEQKKL